MQVLPFLTILATALAGQSFNPLIIRSGSDYQYASLKASGSDVIAGYNDRLQLVLNSDGSLIDSTTKKYVHVGDDHSLTLSNIAQTGFSFSGGYLAYNDKASFAVCGESKVRYFANDSSCLGVAVRIEQPQNTDDVRPAGSETTTFVGDATYATTMPASTITFVAKDEIASTTATQDSATTTVTGAPPSLAGKKFGLIAIHSGSDVQNYPIKKVAEHPHVFSVGGADGESVTFTFSSDSSSLADQDGRGVNLDQETGELGNVAPFGRQPATPGFSIDNDHLTYNGASGWKACPSGEGYSLSHNDCTGGITIELRAVYA